MKPNVQSDNAYEVLGVPRDADIPAIRRAFRKLALKYHPDARPAEEKAEAAATFAKINQAHEILRDSEKRAEYDGLLDQGITPDMSKELGAQAHFQSLADIIGDIRALDFATADNPMADMDFTLKDELVEPSLIHGEGLQETVVDAISFSTLTSESYTPPEGALNTSWIVVTELRVMLALKYVHEWQEGNTKYTKTFYRLLSIPYGSMTELLIHEKGRAYKDYAIDLGDEEGDKFTLGFAGRPGLEKLLLIANTYKLPLRIKSEADAGGEYTVAGLQGFAIPLLWSAPFVIASLCNICGAICNRKSSQFEPMNAWGNILVWMNDHYLTTIALYATPVAIVASFAYVYLSWNTGRAAHLFGDLAVDYSQGSPELEQPTGEAAEAELSNPGVTPAALPEAAEVAMPAAVAEAEAPAALAMPDAVLAMPDAVLAMPDAVLATPDAVLAMPDAVADAGPAALALPSSIADAMGVDDEPASGPAALAPPAAVLGVEEDEGPAALALPSSIADAIGASPALPSLDNIPAAPPLRGGTQIGLGSEPPPSRPPAVVRPDVTPDLSAADYLDVPKSKPLPAGGQAHCPHCGQRFHLPAGLAGSAKCTECGEVFEVS